MAKKTQDPFAGYDMEEREQERRELIQKYLQRSRAEGIGDSTAKLSRVTAQELAERRRRNRMIRAYSAQAYAYMVGNAGSSHAAFAVLDADGVMIRLQGPVGTLTWLERKGIVTGCRWSFEKIGGNAVTAGLEEKRSLFSVGTENYLKVMQDMAIYFSPLIHEDPYEDRGTNLGGIVIIVPIEEHSDAYMMANAAVAGSLLIRISMALRTSDTYDENRTNGIALLDMNLKTGSLTITHHNQLFFDMLGQERLSYLDSYFKPLDELIDPWPANREFWTILRNGQNVTEHDITIRVRGKDRDYLITTKSHLQPGIKSKGMYLQITTKQMIAGEISGKTSNNAILHNGDIIFRSNIMRSRIHKAKLVAQTDSNVMLVGESGVGKDVFAQAIHNMSERRNGPFIAVNCGALPRDLIASELFGYEEGAFTGAKKSGNIGKFELANGGTLFLDEIGELPLELQATLLRAVEQKQFTRLGSNRMIHVDIKIISATNADLERMIREKRFREDLLYRLGSMQIVLPPLREREGDAVLLAEYFAQRSAARTGRKAPVFTEGAKRFLLEYPWYGNVRELQSTIDCVVQLYDDPEITAEHLRDNVNSFVLMGGQIREPQERGFQSFPPKESGSARGETGGKSGPDESAGTEEEGLPYGKPTREELINALEETLGNRTEAAELMGIPRRTFYRYLRKYRIR